MTFKFIIIICIVIVGVKRKNIWGRREKREELCFLIIYLSTQYKSYYTPHNFIYILSNFNYSNHCHYHLDYYSFDRTCSYISYHH